MIIKLCMPDKTNRPAATDLKASHEYEIEVWADSLGATSAQLKDAVQEVGISPRKVRAFLVRARASFENKPK